MTAQELIDKVKITLGILPAPAAPAPAAPVLPTPAPVALTKYQLADGTEVEIDKLEAGGAVMIAGAPAPAGVHTLQDGTTITTDDAGMILEVVPAAAAPAVPPAEDMGAKFAVLQGEFSTHKQAFDAYVTSAEQRFATAEQTISSQALAMSQLISIVEQLAKAPTADPPEETQSKFRFSEVEKKNEALVKLSENLKKLKSK